MNLVTLRHQSFLLSVLLTVAAPLTSHAQSLVRVLDTEGLPVQYALVSVRGAQERLVDSLGYARFSVNLGATPKITVRRLGYARFDGEVSRSSQGEYAVTLTPVSRQLEAVRSVAARNTPLARSGFYDRMHRVQNGAITGTFITPEQLEHRNPTYLSQALQGAASVRVRKLSNGQAFALGRGDCPMEVLVDGIRVNGLAPFPRVQTQRVPVTALHLDELAHGREIAGIEVYGSTANAPAELIPLTGKGSCGLIAIWTGGRH